VNAENTKKYEENIRKAVESKILEQDNENGEGDLDERLYDRIIKDKQPKQRIEDFSEAMSLACEKTLKKQRPQVHLKFRDQFSDGQKNLQQ